MNPSVVENLCFRKLNEMRSNVYQRCKYDAWIIRRDKIYQNMQILFNRKILKIIYALSNDKNTGFNMTVVGTVFTKEADKFTPFLSFEVQSRTQCLLLPSRWYWKIVSISRQGASTQASAIILSTHTFSHKKNEITFSPITFDVTQNLQYTSTLSKNGVVFFNNPHPLFQAFAYFRAELMGNGVSFFFAFA